MRARVAKKVCRAELISPLQAARRYRLPTLIRAHSRIWFVSLRYVFPWPLTAAGRWGKWDPALPLKHGELPF